MTANPTNPDKAFWQRVGANVPESQNDERICKTCRHTITVTETDTMIGLRAPGWCVSVGGQKNDNCLAMTILAEWETRCATIATAFDKAGMAVEGRKHPS